MYLAAHLCFLERTPDEIMDRIANSDVAGHVLSYKEINLPL